VKIIWRSMVSVLVLAVLCCGAVFAAEPPGLQLDLQAAIDMAVANDPQVLSAESAVASAQVKVEQELAKIAPGCAIKASYSQDFTGTGIVHTEKISFAVSQSLPGLLPWTIGAKAAGGVEQAMWDRTDAQAKLDQAKIAAASVVIQKYIIVLQNKEILALQQNALDLAKETERIARVKFGEGMLTKVDVASAGSDTEQARIVLRGAEIDYSNSCNDLSLEIGKPFDLKLTLAAMTLAPADNIPSLAELEEAALKSRPEMLSARTGVRKAEAGLARARNATLPKLQLAATQAVSICKFTVSVDFVSGDISWDFGDLQATTQQSDPPKSSADGLNLSLTLNWNPLDGGAGKAGVESARLGLDSANAALDRQEKQIRLELRQKLGELEMTRLSLAKAVKDREIAGQTYAQAEAEYKEGMILPVTLGQAAQSLAQANNAVVRARDDLFMVWVGLEQLCGRSAIKG